MNILRFEDNEGKYWVRISKAQARKLYNKGGTICLCPCKMRPFSGWEVECVTSSNLHKCDFEKLLDGFVWYNCNAESGKYTSFYKMEV